MQIIANVAGANTFLIFTLFFYFDSCLLLSDILRLEKRD